MPDLWQLWNMRPRPTPRTRRRSRHWKGCECRGCRGTSSEGRWCKRVRRPRASPTRAAAPIFMPRLPLMKPQTLCWTSLANCCTLLHTSTNCCVLPDKLHSQLHVAWEIGTTGVDTRLVQGAEGGALRVVVEVHAVEIIRVEHVEGFRAELDAGPLGDASGLIQRHIRSRYGLEPQPAIIVRREARRVAREFQEVVVGAAVLDAERLHGTPEL